ncbi:hypothetical protein H9P43_009581 [Blastocladiella emersonii ATCC 22665]|nr:hypothetical protein H9P43_009581 [Blastocladiella emersonii ATCC 22665]
MPITLLHNKHAHAVAFDRPLSMVTLAELVATAAATLGVPQAGLRLVYNGGILKDTSATLAQYGLHADSRVLALASQGPPRAPEPSIAPLQPAYTPAAPSPASAPTANLASADPREQAVIATVSDLLAGAMAPLNPLLDRFARAPAAGPPSPDVTKLKGEIGERLMQALLKVDGVAVPPGFEVARAKRREAVNTLQALMDEVEARYRAMMGKRA